MCIYIYIQLRFFPILRICAEMCEAEMLQWKKGTGFILPIWGRIIHLTFPRVSRTKIPMAFPTSPGFGSGPAYENRWKSAMAFSETVPLEHTIKPKKNLGTPRKIQRFSGTEDHGKPSLFHADFLGVYPCLSQLWMWKLETPMENGWPWLTLINQGSDQWITGLSVAEHGGWAPIELPLHHGINWGHHVRQTHMKVR